MVTIQLSSARKTKLRPISLRNERAWHRQSAGHIRRQGSARMQGKRHGRAAAHWEEHAHHFPLLGARISKIMSAERRRAASDGV